TYAFPLRGSWGAFFVIQEQRVFSMAQMAQPASGGNGLTAAQSLPAGEYEAVNGMKFPIINGKVMIPSNLIRPMPGQPRKHFNPEELRGLAASIDATDQAQPVQVHPLDKPDEDGR